MTRSSLRLLSPSLLLAALSAGALPAQLRYAVADAEFVAIARHVAVRPLGNDYFLHRYETTDALKGAVPETFTLVERKRIADVPRPKPGPDRLLCLVTDRGTRDLPQRFAPYLAATGYPGEDVAVDDSAASRSAIELVRTLVSSERGRASRETAAELVRIVMHGAGLARSDAAESLRARPALRDAMSKIDRDTLLLRAVAETEDIDLKISIASLCAESGQQGVVEALCLSLQSEDDPRLARAVGRVAKHVHGEDAFAVLQPFFRQTRGAARARMLLAIGATGTEAALTALLRLRDRDGPSAAVDAALKAHGSPRAVEAIRGRAGSGPIDADRRR